MSQKCLYENPILWQSCREMNSLFLQEYARNQSSVAWFSLCLFPLFEIKKNIKYKYTCIYVYLKNFCLKCRSIFMISFHIRFTGASLTTHQHKCAYHRLQTGHCYNFFPIFLLSLSLISLVDFLKKRKKRKISERMIYMEKDFNERKQIQKTCKCFRQTYGQVFTLKYGNETVLSFRSRNGGCNGFIFFVVRWLHYFPAFNRSFFFQDL